MVGFAVDQRRDDNILKFKECGALIWPILSERQLDSVTSRDASTELCHAVLSIAAIFAGDEGRSGYHFTQSEWQIALDELPNTGESTEKSRGRFLTHLYLVQPSPENPDLWLTVRIGYCLCNQVRRSRSVSCLSV